MAARAPKAVPGQVDSLLSRETMVGAGMAEQREGPALPQTRGRSTETRDGRDGTTRPLPSLMVRLRWVVAAAALLLIGTAALNLLVCYVSLDVLEAGGAHQAARLTATVLEEKLRSQRSAVAQLAGSDEAVALLRAGDREGAQAWAQAARRLLPDTVGVALIDVEGNVLGEPEGLGISRLCITDFRRRLDGLSTPILPVHHSVPGGRHFDLHREVTDESGTVRGTLLLTIEMGPLGRLLDRITAPEDTAAVLIEARGERVLEAGPRLASDAPSAAYHPIGQTGWTLAVHRNPPTVRALLSWVGVSVLIAAILTTVLALALSRYLAAAYQREFERLGGLLASPWRARELDSDTLKPGFLEIEPFHRLVMNLARQLERRQRKLSARGTTDEATGLSNRRHFQKELERVFPLAQRGMRVAVAFIGLEQSETTESAGDNVGGVLTALAGALRRQARRSDLVARWSREEFAVALLDASAEQAHAWLERLCEEFRIQQVHLRGNKDTGCCNLSCGFSFMQKESDRGPEQVLERARQALAKAREEGPDHIEQHAA